MTLALVLAALLYGGFLLAESHRLRAARGRLEHIVHVNGTRGKSTVSRLIEAGLRAGGVRVFCKTTGTDPMTIDVFGHEEPVRRRGRANIKEQIGIVQRAAAQGAQVLVVECMALAPELQSASQHDILRADIGVITNVRRDHTDVMGETTAQIADALSNTVPRCGVLFTAELPQSGRLEEKARALGSEFILVVPRGDEGEFDFPENIALALAVCERLGVPRETALRGMHGFSRDPYALSLHRLGQAVFAGGLSINDIQSICIVWQKLRAQYGWEEKRLTLLINNRADRGSRTQDMLRACAQLRPDEVWLMGASRGYMKRGVHRLLPDAPVRELKSAAELPVDALTEERVIYAIGNIAGEGRPLMERVRKEGTALV